MSARAIWQGTLVVQKLEIAVKFYAAVADRQVHFHLLDKRDRSRVEQRMVDPETGRVVPLSEARKAFEAEPGLYIPVSPQEIERIAQKPGRDVRISRCVPVDAIDFQRFDRPYYLGPAGDSSTDYFALAQALEHRKVACIARWVMRKHSYVGALTATNGYLMMITLRHEGEVIPVGKLDPPLGRPLEPKEKTLAKTLIDALSGEFDPRVYRDTYQDRVRELIEAKRRGKAVKKKRMPRRRAESTLVASLQSSLKQVAPRRRSR